MFSKQKNMGRENIVYIYLHLSDSMKVRALSDFRSINVIFIGRY